MSSSHHAGQPETLSGRPCIPEDDLGRIVDLLLDYRVATGVRVYQTAWRLRLLLTSRVKEPALDARIWEDSTGQVVGFAMLWRRRHDDAYLVLDRLLHPVSVTGQLEDAQLEWGTRRAWAIATEQAVPLTLYAGALDAAICPVPRLEAHGFMPITPDPHKCNVYFSRSLKTTLPESTLLKGYTLRPLEGSDELETYSALHGFAAVDPQHRQALLNSDEYCHLVVVDPTGSFVAYCECSMWRAEWQRSGQAIGWIDYVGTRPELRRRGFGRSILLAGLAHLRAWGADTAMLVTISTNSPAVKLYHSVGMTGVDSVEAPRYEKHILP